MRLERLYFDIDRVVFGESSYIKDHTLVIDRQELEKTAGSDLFSGVEINIAEPGSNARILSIGDTIQPTIRIDDSETTFPGLTGKMYTVGDGRALMLRGVAVSEVVEMRVDIPSILQFTEEAAEITKLANMWHITMDAYPAPGVTKNDYLTALNISSKRLAKHIASLASGLEPDETEAFELKREVPAGLPRVAYLADVFCHRPHTESLIYGVSMYESLPTILHPNEILDGALINRNYDQSFNANPTYIWQNHPIILELYKRHGIDLNFVGVVLNNVHHEMAWKERNAVMASALLNNVLRAEAAIITKDGGGHPQVDVGLAIDTLEGRYGIKTVAVLVEMLSHINDSYGQIIFNSDYANAIVSTGCTAAVTLPPPKTVIGSLWHDDHMGIGATDKTGEMRLNHRVLRGGQSQLGWSWFSSHKY